ncbi:MAG: enoyl-CoA hydratase-related protein, partial [Pseudomonadota bacterium]
GWLSLSFNRPENRNALTDELVGELTETLEMVRPDRTVRGITLRGKGGVFCAGGDLKAFQSGFHGDAASPEQVAKANRAGGELFELINTMPQVVVALVDGPAVAGGMGMVCCADVVVVTKGAKFALTETQRGIVPAQIAPYIVRRLGLRHARRLMLTGQRFSGQQAEEYGLSDFLVDDASGFDGVEAEIIKDVMRCAPGANAVTKQVVQAVPYLSTDEMKDYAAEGFARCMLSDEGKEGIASFIEKRKPSWAEQS